MPAAETLHRVEDVDAGLVKVLQEGDDGAAAVVEGLPLGVGVNPVVDFLVVGLVELPVCVGRHVGAGLDAEVGAGDVHGLDLVVHRLVDQLGVLQAHFQLHLVDLMDVVGEGVVGHHVLGQIADALGVLDAGAGHRGEVAEAGQGAVAEDAVLGVVVPVVHIVLEAAQLFVGVHAEVVAVVGPAGGLVVVVILHVAADDVVKEEAVFRHHAGRGDAGVALGIEVGAAVLVHGGVEHLRDQDLQARLHGPGLPALVEEAEQGLAGGHAHHVHMEGLPHILFHLAQELQRLVDFDFPLLQAQLGAQARQRVGVDAGDGIGAQIDHNFAGILVVQRQLQAFSRCHCHNHFLLFLR